MKTITKHTAWWLGAIIVLPMIISNRLAALLLGRDRALEGASQWLGLIPGMLGSTIRSAFYRFTLEHCDWTARIEFGTLFSKAGTRIGRHAYIGPRCHVGLADIGEDALIAAGVHIPSGPHTHGTSDLSQPIRCQPGSPTRIHIGPGSWIGSASIVFADVGEDTIVGAGSVVTKTIGRRGRSRRDSREGYQEPR